jgi:hypothetical protein
LETTTQCDGAVTLKVKTALRSGWHLELAVEVDLVVGGVDEAVQALAGVGVGAVGGDDERVGRLEVVERDTAVGVRRGRVEAATVEGDLADGRGDQVGEGAGAGLTAGELERGGGDEGGLVGVGG